MPRPKIVFQGDFPKPFGPWSRAFINEVGIVCRDFIPLSCHTWTDVDKGEVIKLLGHLLKKFDLDLHTPSMVRIINKFFAERFKDYRCRLHMRYKRVGRQNPYKGLTLEAWTGICDWFETEEFQNLSKQNSENREKQLVNHWGGSKPFVIHLEDQRDPDTQAVPGRIEFYRLMHFDSKKGWICPLAQENYDKMIDLKSQDPPQGSPPKTEDEIYEIICGKRSGYIMGLGHGKIPPSKRSSPTCNHYDMEEIRQRAEAAERRNEDLATQLHDQGLEIEEMKR